MRNHVLNAVVLCFLAAVSYLSWSNSQQLDLVVKQNNALYSLVKSGPPRTSSVSEASSISPSKSGSDIGSLVEIALNKRLEEDAADKRSSLFRDFQNANEKVKGNIRIYGNPDARFTMIVYSDYECPYCRKFDPFTKRIVDESNGQLNLVIRHFPLGFHNPSATEQSAAAECAGEIGGNRVFWVMNDLLFKNTRSNNNGLMRPISELVTDLGLPMGEFANCMKSSAPLETIAIHKQEGVSAGVEQTPSTILRDNVSKQMMFVPGAQEAVIKDTVTALVNAAARS